MGLKKEGRKEDDGGWRKNLRQWRDTRGGEGATEEWGGGRPPPPAAALERPQRLPVISGGARGPTATTLPHPPPPGPPAGPSTTYNLVERLVFLIRKNTRPVAPKPFALRHPG